MVYPPITDIIRDTGLISFGGQQVGYAQDGVEFDPQYVITPIYFEDSGMIPQHFIYSGMTALFRFSCISFNDKSFKLAFVQRGINSYPRLSIPGNLKTGTLVSTTCKTSFSFVPQNPAHPKITSSDCFAFVRKSINIKYTDLSTLFLFVYCKDLETSAQ